MLRELQTTADGSATLYLPEMDEHYHSVKGALTESNHIFIECGLRHCKKREIRVLEVGFGTGLNALLSALEAKGHVTYFTLELYPLSAEYIKAVNYGAITGYPNAETIFHALHMAQWDTLSEITSQFTLCKMLCDFVSEQTILPKDIDVVYFDAFAPDKQPEMWDVKLLQRVYNSMSPGGILTTYCSKGEIRRRLQSVGFIVERLLGPPGGKREILRATKSVGSE